MRCGPTAKYTIFIVFNVILEKLVELDTRVTGIEHQIVKRKRDQGRPKASKNKKKLLHGTNVDKNHRMIDASSQNNCDGDIERLGKKIGQGGPSCSKNRRKAALTSEIDHHTVNSGVHYGIGEVRIDKGKNRKKEKDAIYDDLRGVLGEFFAVDGDRHRIKKSKDSKGGPKDSKNMKLSIAVEKDSETTIDVSHSVKPGAELVKKDRRGRHKGVKNKKTLAAERDQVNLGGESTYKSFTEKDGCEPYGLKRKRWINSSGEYIRAQKRRSGKPLTNINEGYESIFMGEKIPSGNVKTKVPSSLGKSRPTVSPCGTH